MTHRFPIYCTPSVGGWRHNGNPKTPSRLPGTLPPDWSPTTPLLYVVIYTARIIYFRQLRLYPWRTICALRGTLALLRQSILFLEIPLHVAALSRRLMLHLPSHQRICVQRRGLLILRRWLLAPLAPHEGRPCPPRTPQSDTECAASRLHMMPSSTGSAIKRICSVKDVALQLKLIKQCKSGISFCNVQPFSPLKGTSRHHREG